MTTMDVNMATMERVVKKVQPVLGSFDQENYHTERIWATASDGTKVSSDAPPLSYPLMAAGRAEVPARPHQWHRNNGQ